MQPDTSARYGTLSRCFHWIMALGFLFMLGTAAAWNYDEAYFSLMKYHKSVGFILLILAALRLLWAVANHSRRPSGTLMAKLGHAALYLLMIAVPAAAMIRQAGSDKHDLQVFGIHIMSKAPEKIEWMVELGNQWHGKLAWLLFILAAGHIVMAVIHQIKGEKIINRMAR
ncbi:cytochrome b [Neisseria lisongii]|uniref:Cytochrome b/b6 domain-containing protein n=1 Tax=Neisseria lisongii TaxID=2912188 RepID=A0AAW5AGE2_9NEIS|nr:cytochrome b/b6 domain-containing protein [Neisseria lisongii]MCF7529018.1 cytochrome b/b6 domain-containing protein [Neisseria lisongii]